MPALPAVVALLDGLRAVARGRGVDAEAVFEEAQEEERAYAAAAVAHRAAGGEDVGGDADVLLADDPQGLDERDALRPERVDLLVVGDALRLAHQANLLGLGLARGEYVVRLAVGLRLALLGAARGDFDADRRRHKVFLVVGVGAGLLKLYALLLGLALRVVHVLALLGENLLGLRLHQLFGKVYVADEDVDHVHVVLEEVRADAGLGALLLLVAVLQVRHRRRLGRLVAEDGVDERVHDVLYEPVDAANLRDHEGRVLRLDAEDDAHFELHREAVFRDDLERVERVRRVARSPLDRLVGRRDDDGRDGERVDVVAAGADDRLLYAAEALGDDVRLVRALVEPLVGGVGRHQVLLDLGLRAVLVVELVEAGDGVRDVQLLLALHARAHFICHLAAHVLAGVFADVRDDDGDLARLDLAGLFGDDLEDERVDVVGAGQKYVLLRAALAAAADELVAVGEVVVPLDGGGDVVARVERRAVEGLDESDLILVNHGRVEEAHEEESGLRVAALDGDALRVYAVGAGGEYLDLRPLLPAAGDERLGVLKVLVTVDGLAVQAAGVERVAVRRGEDADLARRNHRRLRDGDAEQVRVYRPEPRRERPQLYALDAAALDEGDGVLEVVVGVLRAVEREVASGLHRLAVNRLDDAQLVRPHLDERHLAYDFLEGPLDEVQAGLEHVGLYADLALGGDDAARRHLRAEVAPLFDRYLARADVDEPAAHDGHEDDERREGEQGEHHVVEHFVVHCLSFCAASPAGAGLPKGVGRRRRSESASERRTCASFCLSWKPAPERRASEDRSQYSASKSARSSSELESARRSSSRARSTA